MLCRGGRVWHLLPVRGPHPQPYARPCFPVTLARSCSNTWSAATEPGPDEDPTAAVAADQPSAAAASPSAARSHSPRVSTCGAAAAASGGGSILLWCVSALCEHSS